MVPLQSFLTGAPNKIRIVVRALGHVEPICTSAYLKFAFNLDYMSRRIK